MSERLLILVFWSMKTIHVILPSRTRQLQHSHHTLMFSFVHCAGWSKLK